MEFLAILVAVIVGFVATRPPPPYVPPDLSACKLAHGFVIGDAPPFPGAIEIYRCSGQTVVTLEQMQPEREIRTHFTPAAGRGEQLMGCRGHDENYDGIVALAASAGQPDQKIRRAWKADVEKWAFVSTPTTGIVCNRGLTVE